ncbi:MAG: single-stranded-DNA-specific exonuclease RecJ [Fibrobacteres bacterium]|nr:single-stranded-DNA-specific exonuclease RecJ [Fibrobacterota bacterium]
MKTTTLNERIKPPKLVSPETVKAIMEAFSLPLITAKILVGRGWDTVESASTFLKPELAKLNSPFMFTDMAKAVDRILAASASQEKVCIHGDYDVDGITATALLTRFLRKIGISASTYVPHRLNEGYGLSEDGIRKIADQGARLLITVDCGITSIKEAALAKSLGMDVIITDHHLPLAELPEVCAILNPKVDSLYPDRDLAGVGVALKLAQALAVKAGLSETEALQFADLAAIGTAADIAPLINENRSITRLGIDSLKRSPIEGIKALLRAAGLYDKQIDTTRILFQIAPLINAMGRMGDPARCVEFFLTDDPAKAGRLADELQKNNTDRRSVDQSMTEECFRMVDATFSPKSTAFITLFNPGWHAGVLGIVASRVMEKYCRPTLVFTEVDGMARGSARSIPGLNLFDAIADSADLLDHYGGHAFAAGVTMKRDNLKEFSERLNRYASRQLTEKDFVRTHETDVEADTLDQLDFTLYKSLLEFEPHGAGNQRPVFFCRGGETVGRPRIVGNGHLKFNVRKGSKVYDAIAFRQGDKMAIVEGSRDLTLAFTLEENTWMGNTTLQLNVRGIE